MDELVSRDAAIQAMLKEQQDDIKAYGCSIPECFDGDRASSVLMQLPAIDPDMSDYSERLWHLAYERGKNEGIVQCKYCKWSRCHINVDKQGETETYWRCMNWDGETDEEGYCHDWKRRTDATN